ncbi:MAG: putative quinol monooxygenase [Gammaproteobacteria bacterium]
MIELHLVLRVPPNKTRPMIDALITLAKNARAETGCIAVQVYRAFGVPHCVCYDETWESESVLRRMIASRHFSQLASLMELSSEPPDCQFRFIAEIRGLEFAAQVRDDSDDK